MAHALYESWPEGSRRSWGLGALGVLIVTFVLAAVVSTLPIIVVTIIEVASGADPDTIADQVQNNAIGVLLPSILIQFSVWSWLTLLWVRHFERRDMASLGLVPGFLAPLRYVFGLGLGILLVMAIGSVGLMLSGGEVGVAPDAAESVERFSDPTTLALLCFIVVVFLIQGGSEEFVFRGWLMSALAARWGTRAAVIVSSLCFMVLHAHVFISGWVFGSIALVGLGLMGLVFALLCLLTRSIIEAIAAHGAFNATTITVTSAAMLVENPELGLAEILNTVFATSTGTAGPDAVQIDPALFAQGLTAGVISAVIVLTLMARGRKPVDYTPPAPETVEEGGAGIVQ